MRCRRDRSHGKLSASRRAELAHEENVQRRIERFGYFEGDGDTAPRQREYDNVRSSRVATQAGRQFPPRFTAIGKRPTQSSEHSSTPLEGRPAHWSWSKRGTRKRFRPAADDLMSRMAPRLRQWLREMVYETA
jgi:hypothetical protein